MDRRRSVLLTLPPSLLRNALGCLHKRVTKVDQWPSWHVRMSSGMSPTQGSKSRRQRQLESGLQADTCPVSDDAGSWGPSYLGQPLEFSRGLLQKCPLNRSISHALPFALQRQPTTLASFFYFHRIAMPVPESTEGPFPKLHHLALHTTFRGLQHPLSTPSAPIHQYRGIKYASIPARFRQSKLFHSYPPITDATTYG